MSCRFREKRKNARLNSKKISHRAEGQPVKKLLTDYRTVSGFRKPWFLEAWNWLL